MAAGIVDNFELIEVEIAQRVRSLSSLGAFQRAFQALLKFPAIHQARQNIVARVITEPAV